MQKKIIYFIVGVGLLVGSGFLYSANSTTTEPKFNGVCFVAPPKPIQAEAMAPIKTINADWVAVTPYAFSRKDNPKIVFNRSNQWWGEKVEGTIKTIEYAKDLGLKVMLKPHVWVMGDGWAGEFEAESEEKWKLWEASYTDYIMTFAEVADSMQVEMICIGTEYKKAVQQRPEFWVGLIAKIRKIYSGQVTYAANWDNYMNVTFWDKLDYIGIDAYFPVCNSTTPSPDELEGLWGETVSVLEKFSASQGKKILFTEYGYRSMDQCAGGNWDMDNQSVQPNMQAQQNALEGFYRVFWKKNWVQGGFLWKWFANYPNAGGMNDSHYTPQNKPAEDVIRKWYSKG